MWRWFDFTVRMQKILPKQKWTGTIRYFVYIFFTFLLIFFSFIIVIPSSVLSSLLLPAKTSWEVRQGCSVLSIQLVYPQTKIKRNCCRKCKYVNSCAHRRATGCTYTPIAHQLQTGRRPIQITIIIIWFLNVVNKSHESQENPNTHRISGSRMYSSARFLFPASAFFRCFTIFYFRLFIHLIRGRSHSFRMIWGRRRNREKNPKKKNI